MTKDSSYSRSQAQDLTGLDAQMLDYLTRLGALQPSAGGGGKGHHRKYDQFQITLGRMLKEIAGFGLGGSALATIATEFQQSIGWFKSKGLAEYALAASSLIHYRHELETQGYVDMNVVRGTPLQNVKERIYSDDWQGLVALHQVIAPLPDAIVEVCKSVPFEEMRQHYDRFMALSPGGDGKSTSGEIYLFLSEAGSWEIDFEEQPAKATSFITIRLRSLKRSLWRRS
ncbi:hypothetical protein [Novosphingobium ginsenosidimutans]|uniref:Uncharacterized protein n=1 Tax=Novosphingobium ginsenosidimutans TaxID=1176536 RepID=A0A5B8S6L1_9SPHN|nr:hypothetical protein [Novosphingobium ginsenosidimutans]QEA16065.1 hypothetical protein FRF71_07915 [Novosphingobium ginsenosidimutans]